MTPWHNCKAADGVWVFQRDWSDLLGSHHEEVVTHGHEQRPAVQLAAQLGMSQQDLAAVLRHSLTAERPEYCYWLVYRRNGETSRIVRGDRELAATVESIGASRIEPADYSDWSCREAARHADIRRKYA